MAVEYVNMVALEGGLTDSVASKLSSTALRRHMLGEYRTPKVDRTISPRDGEGLFVIGLTGGMASGKSSLCQRLAQLGAKVVDCDKVRLGACRGDGGSGQRCLDRSMQMSLFSFHDQIEPLPTECISESIRHHPIIMYICPYNQAIKCIYCMYLYVDAYVCTLQII